MDVFDEVTNEQIEEACTLKVQNLERDLRYLLGETIRAHDNLFKTMSTHENMQDVKASVLDSYLVLSAAINRFKELKESLNIEQLERFARWN